MATTFTPAWKNTLIDALTGRASTSGNVPSYAHFYAGAQQPDPLTGSSFGVFSSYSIGVNITSLFSAPSGGIATLSVPRSAAASFSLAAITTCRLLNPSGTAIIDTPATLDGGGGGCIVPSLTSTAAAQFVISKLTIKLPSNLGTLYMNDALRDAMLSAICVAPTNPQAFSSASIKVYSGSAPANANLPATGNLLATFSTAASGTSWNVAAAGSAALASNISAVVSGAGTQTAGYARIEKGTYVMQLAIGTSGTDLVFDSLSFTNGETRNLINATITW